MIKGIIFDLDGTTLNTLYDILDSTNMTLDFFNYPNKTYDEVRMAVGRGSRNLIKDVFPKNTNEETIDKALKKYIEIYNQNYNKKTKPYDGILDLLEELNKKNILLGVNSNKPDNLTKALIKKHFPNIKFIEVYGAVNGVPHKPDPTLANNIISKMELKKDEVLYVGDSETDIKTAKNTEVKSIGCLWGFRDFETLKNAKADYIISNPKEILNYL